MVNNEYRVGQLASTENNPTTPFVSNLSIDLLIFGVCLQSTLLAEASELRSWFESNSFKEDLRKFS